MGWNHTKKCKAVSIAKNLGWDAGAVKERLREPRTSPRYWLDALMADSYLAKMFEGTSVLEVQVPTQVKAKQGKGI